MVTVNNCYLKIIPNTHVIRFLCSFFFSLLPELQVLLLSITVFVIINAIDVLFDIFKDNIQLLS